MCVECGKPAVVDKVSVDYLWIACGFVLGRVPRHRVAESDECENNGAKTRMQDSRGIHSVVHSLCIRNGDKIGGQRSACRIRGSLNP